MTRNPLNDIGNNLGDYLREQREAARLSVRQLSELAGVSNPYLSQIERGLKKPSADILQQIAKGLQVSAESLYIRAGLLDPDDAEPRTRPAVIDAIKHDDALTSRQKTALIDIYQSFAAVPDDAEEDQARDDDVMASRSRAAQAAETDRPTKRAARRRASTAASASGATPRTTSTKTSRTSRPRQAGTTTRKSTSEGARS